MGSSLAEVASRRLFLALWPDAAARTALAALAMRVAGAQAVPADNLHLTLVFLGATPAALQACYGEALADLSFAPISLALDRLGGWRGPRVVWAGPTQTPAALMELVAELQRRLAGCGFVPEARPFRAHVTLARKLPGSTLEVALDDPIQWLSTRVALVESVGGPEGVRYRPLRFWEATAG